MNKYEINSIIKGRVTGIEKYGIFISIDEEYSGLIHISEVASAYVRDINSFVKVDEIIRVKIIAIDLERKHLQLSIKDIDYKLSKSKRDKIEETDKGFSTLAHLLPLWIKEKVEEIDIIKIK